MRLGRLQAILGQSRGGIRHRGPAAGVGHVPDGAWRWRCCTGGGDRMSEPDRTRLPIRRPSFGGVANRTLAGSAPDWGLIGHVEPPMGSPNVLLVLIDDAGFGNPA